MDSSRNNGEFSTQEIRAYMPVSLGQTTLTPYTRLGLDRWTNWDWRDDPTREGHDFNRLGLLYAYDFANGLSMTLEYAYEWENHDEGKTIASTMRDRRELRVLTGRYGGVWF